MLDYLWCFFVAEEKIPNRNNKSLSEDPEFSKRLCVGWQFD
jgi:hypothetical protein